LSKARKIIVDTRNQARCWTSRRDQNCPGCGFPFKSGMVVIAKKSTVTRWYHYKCAIKFNIWDEDNG
ncbi:MAG: hypothetical protein ACE5Q4_04695, partial [Nitrosopumilus sp.]